MLNSRSQTAHPQLLAISDLDQNQIRFLLDVAKAFSQKSHPAFLQGKTIVNLFFENSTRTRSSFELAIRRLGGSAFNFAVSTSSVQKGETLIDTAKNLMAMQADCFVVRHASAGSPKY